MLQSGRGVVPSGRVASAGVQHSDARRDRIRRENHELYAMAELA
jgi:hypothetical protein